MSYTKLKRAKIKNIDKIHNNNILKQFFIIFYMLNFAGGSLPKTDKRNNKQTVDPTVIDEGLIM